MKLVAVVAANFGYLIKIDIQNFIRCGLKSDSFFEHFGINFSYIILNYLCWIINCY
jgi:hypothetical protein